MRGCGALGLPEGLHATLPPTHAPHRQITMINMSPGEQEAANGHAALVLFHGGRGFEISDDTEKLAHKRVFSDRRCICRHLKPQGREASEQVELSGYGDVTEQNTPFPSCLCTYKDHRCAEVTNAPVNVQQQAADVATFPRSHSFHCFIKTLHWWPR